MNVEKNYEEIIKELRLNYNCDDILNELQYISCDLVDESHCAIQHYGSDINKCPRVRQLKEYKRTLELMLPADIRDAYYEGYYDCPPVRPVLTTIEPITLNPNLN